MDSRKKYAEIAKKCKLPKLEDLERVFAFKLSKDSEDFYFDIIKGMEESIIYARQVMENILFIKEGSSQTQLYESRFMNKDLFTAYKKLMELKWKYRKVYFDTREKDCNDFIRESYDIWTKEIKNHLVELCKNMEIAWKSYKKNRQEKQSYIG